MCSSAQSSFTRTPICFASAMGKVRTPVLSYFGAMRADGSRRTLGPETRPFPFLPLLTMRSPR